MEKKIPGSGISDALPVQIQPGRNIRLVSWSYTVGDVKYSPGNVRAPIAVRGMATGSVMNC